MQKAIAQRQPAAVPAAVEMTVKETEVARKAGNDSGEKAGTTERGLLQTKNMDILELTNCGTRTLHFSITFPQAIERADLQALGRGRVIVENPAFSPPHFKIVDKRFILRGALGQARLSAQFDNDDKQACLQILADLNKELL